MKKLALFGMLLVVSLTLSCATRGVNNIEAGMRQSDNIYYDLAPQIATALQFGPEDPSKVNHLKLTSQKLENYRKAYTECSKAVNLWKSTGQSPDNMIDLYAEMWRYLVDAQHLAAHVYIYASECTANTGLKGKAGNNCR
jgi:hypothetical protein